ncbi:ribonuclease H-like domain-containing protein [Tanacetum coccineum]
MYSFDLKNVVPSGGLTCLFAKAIIDESNLWHRRLGHINFKTMNKLVRGNLVRGLPLKFCGIKEIKREFSVARTPQQNRVAERKNKTLIEAARTMLAYSLLPTTFWAEATTSIKFYETFRCLVIFLNTFDPLENWIEKADEGFFVGYFINSKAFRVFNTRTRKVKENMHINFLENKPNVAGSGPDWLFDTDLLTNSLNYEPVTAGNQTNKNAGIKDNVDAVPTQQYILLPLLYDSPQSSKDAVADDAGKKTNEELTNEGERNGQEKEGGASNKEDDQNVQDFRAELDNLLVQQKKGYANSTNKDSTVSPSVSIAEQNFTNADDLPTDSLIPDLEDTGIFSGAYDDEDMGAEADLNNLETTMNVSPIPTTRIHKDHPKDQIIRDINSATQTRRMTKISKEHAMMDVKSAFLYGTIEDEVMEEAAGCDVTLQINELDHGTYLTALDPDILFAVCACARDSPFDLKAFTDSDYAGASLGRKSTTGRGTDSGSGPRCQNTILGGAEAQIRFEAASKQSNDPPLSKVNTLGSGRGKS